MKEIKVEPYAVSSSVDNWGDSIFLSKVKCLQIQNDKLYFVDDELFKIIESDKHFELNNMFGRQGEGPEDFVYIERMLVFNDSLFYVYDPAHAFMICCNQKGGFVNRYKLLDYQIMPRCRFVVNDSNLVIANGKEKLVFLDYNMKTGAASFWGEKTSFANAKQYLIRNNRHVFLYKDKYISVSDNLPFIEIYDKQNKRLLEKYDYSDIEVIQEALFENENVAADSYMIIVPDAYVDRDYLYLLLSERKERKTIVNKLLKFDLSSMKMNEIIQFPGHYYTSFCVENDTVYAFNHSDSRIEMLTKGGVK